MAGSRVHNLYRRRSEREGSLPRGSAGRHPTAARRGPRPPAPTPADHAPHELMALSRTLFDTPDEGEILRLALDHMAAAGPYSAEAGYLKVDGGLVPSPTNGQIHALAVDRRVREPAGQDGSVTVPGRPWGRALGRGLERLHGYLVMTSRSRPTEAERSLLATLVRHTAAALSVALAHRCHREDALELHRLREERTALQRQLISLVAELGCQRAVHALMADVAASGGGEEAITRALHGLTGLPALVEDRFGRLRSWTGPGRPDPYPEPDPVRQDEMLHAVAREVGPVRIKDRLITLVRPHGEILGVPALVDARDEADEHTVLALEHAATSLALELAHLHHLAEVELRAVRRSVSEQRQIHRPAGPRGARWETAGCRPSGRGRSTPRPPSRWATPQQPARRRSPSPDLWPREPLAGQRASHPVSAQVVLRTFPDPVQGILMQHGRAFNSCFPPEVQVAQPVHRLGNDVSFQVKARPQSF